MSGSGGSGESATALAASKEERKRNRDLRDSAVSVLESIPQIPIHVTEIKRLIMKARNAKDRVFTLQLLSVPFFCIESNPLSAKSFLLPPFFVKRN